MSDCVTLLRAKEIADLLLEARVAGAKIVMLTGPSGVGKTWLARKALASAADDGVLVGWGKYGEADDQSALGPVMDALSALLEHALDRFFVVQTGLASLTDALGVHLDVLIAAGLTAPGLAVQVEIRALSDSRGVAKRLSVAVSSLLAWLEGFGAPRMILIDDWQRASPEGRELIWAIAGLAVAEPLTIVLTQQETSLASDHSGRARTIVQRLGNLADAEVEVLLSKHLDSPEKAVLMLDFFGDAIPRLPFHLIEAADALTQNGAFSYGEGRWLLDRTVANRLEFDALTRIKRLTPSQLEIVAALAIWGDSAPLAAFQVSMGSSFSYGALENELSALARAAIVLLTKARVAFRHDLLRRAVLETTPSFTLKRLAGEMAERLSRQDDGSEGETAALRLRNLAGFQGIASQRWCERFARGAAAARSRSDMAAASSFAEAALSLRERGALLERPINRLVLREAVLAAAHRDDPETITRAEALIASAETATEICQDYQTGVTALRFAGQPEQAWALTCQGLRRIGVPPPPVRPGLSLVMAALRWILGRWRYPGCRDPKELARLDAFTGFAAVAATIAYHRDPRGTAVIGFEASTLARRRSLHSAYWLGVDAFLFAILGQPERAAQSGEQALAAFPEQRVMRAATLYQAIFFGVHWRRPLKSQRARFPEITRLAYDEGDMLTAAYSLRIYIMSGWRTSESLDRLLVEARGAHQVLCELGEASFSDEMASMIATLEGLTGVRAWAPSLWRTDLPTRNHVIDLELANLAGDWHETVRRVGQLRPLRQSYSVQADSIVMAFHELLATLRCGLRVRPSALALLRRAARLNPADHCSKLLLITAERLRLRSRRPQQVMEAYAMAVEAAAHSDSRLDEALATNCAADAAMGFGDRRLAADYQARTEGIRRAWGARARTAPTAPTINTAEGEARVMAAERADHAKSQLLIHVAHELRTPLQALQTLLDVATTGDQAVDLGEVRDVLASLKGVVDDLNIAHSLAEEMPSGQVRHGDLAELIRSELGVWRAQGEIAFHHDGLAPTVEIPADRLRQIVRNLLSNAVKYGEGSPIDISLSTEKAGEDAVSVCIRVSDQGPGLPEGDIDILFDPFQRGDRAGDNNGVGLGLTLSRRIAGRMGGALIAHNNPGGGACFQLSFEARISRQRPTPPPLPRTLSILVVEDTSLIRKLLNTMLTSLGHTVCDAATAADALAASRTHTFDLVILDVGLPDASGLTVLSSIREEQGPSHPCPVILLTASMSGRAEEVSKADPLVRVLRKPASASSLVEAISELVGAASPGRPSPAHLQELSELDRAAEVEIRQRAAAFLHNRDLATPEAAHQLSGLAAQFGWPDMACAVEAFGLAVRSGYCNEAAVSEVQRVLASMEAAPEAAR